MSVHIVVFDLLGPVAIPFHASLVVCEKLRTVFLGACGYHFGKFSIPGEFSGHPDRKLDIRNSNRHPYFLCIPDETFSSIKQIVVFHKHSYNEDEKNIYKNMDSLIDFETGIAWKLHILFQGNPKADTVQLPAEVGRYLQPSTTWHSVTPFLKTRHLRIKRSEKHDSDNYMNALDREISSNVSFELENHGFPPAVEIRLNRSHLLYPQCSGNHCSDFLRNRKEPKGSEMDYGHSITIRFSEPVTGPIILGKNSHMGMGLFGTF